MKTVHYLEKLSTAYFNKAVSSYFFKQANLLTNMAARVMYSTLPYNEQMNNIVALQSLLPGAKELFNYGMKALMDEIQFAGDANAAEKVVWDYSNGKILESLTKAFKIFSNKNNWEDAYGGVAWANITKNLLELHKCIKNVENAKKKGDWDTYEKQLREMVVYMNVMDGITHNSGTLLDKMIDFELDEKLQNKSNFLIEKNIYTKEMEKILDAKELKNPKDVAKVVYPALKSAPERFQPFKDVLWKVENAGDNKLSTEQQLKLIRLKKETTDIIKRIKRNIDDAKSLNNLREKSSAMQLAARALNILSDVFRMSYFIDEANEMKKVYIYVEKNFWRISEEDEDEITSLDISNKSMKALEDMYNKIISMFE
jgi:hypothetical protein